MSAVPVVLLWVALVSVDICICGVGMNGSGRKRFHASAAPVTAAASARNSPVFLLVERPGVCGSVDLSGIVFFFWPPY